VVNDSYHSILWKPLALFVFSATTICASI
jgi:hypothetical protein